jgi:two-component system, OmpR family, response regulator
MEAKVLLVDDEKDFLESMSERMRLRGMDVTTASSAKEALALIESDFFDAVILDFQLPEMDGLAVLKNIKAKHPEAQIILLTGHATLESGVKAMKDGASDYLEKPADLNELSEKIMAAKDEKMLIVQKQQLDSVLDTIKKYGI